MAEESCFFPEEPSLNHRPGLRSFPAQSAAHSRRDGGGAPDADDLAGPEGGGRVPVQPGRQAGEARGGDRGGGPGATGLSRRESARHGLLTPG